jgi:hypothetical protein
MKSVLGVSQVSGSERKRLTIMIFHPNNIPFPSFLKLKKKTQVF